MLVIGLNGKMRSGKSYVADAMAKLASEHMELRVVRCSFATPLKNLCIREFGWNGKKDERGRRLLQVVGTEAGRAYDPDIWITKWTNEVFSITDRRADIVIADDVRFENEKDEIERRWHGRVIKVVRMNEDGTEFLDGEVSERNHASEQGLDCKVAICVRSGDLAKLRSRAEECLKIAWEKNSGEKRP